jgi:hypothetical protein
MMNNLEYAARYHQQELLREAREGRMARDATRDRDRHTVLQHQLTAAVLSLLMIIVLAALV